MYSKNNEIPEDWIRKSIEGFFPKKKLINLNPPIAWMK
jgi:hypothetical protein